MKPLSLVVVLDVQFSPWCRVSLSAPRSQVLAVLTVLRAFRVACTSYF